MTHVSLFTGIGGLDLASEWAGFETILQVEMDDYATKVLEKHWPTVKRIWDIRDVTAESVNQPVTVISGGPPCQPASLAGRRSGQNDDRWLWPEFIRVVGEILPRWVVAENPPGILSLENGLVVEKLLNEMENYGYKFLPPLLYSAACVGARHKRERVFFMAHLSEEGLQEFFPQKAEQKSRSGFNWFPMPEVRDACNPTEVFIRRGLPGIPGRVDRIKCLGNAVVPQQAYPIFKAIAEVESFAGVTNA